MEFGALFLAHCPRLLPRESIASPAGETDHDIESVADVGRRELRPIQSRWLPGEIMPRQCLSEIRRQRRSRLSAERVCHEKGSTERNKPGTHRASSVLD